MTFQFGTMIFIQTPSGKESRASLLAKAINGFKNMLRWYAQSGYENSLIDLVEDAVVVSHSFLVHVAPVWYNAAPLNR